MAKTEQKMIDFYFRKHHLVRKHFQHENGQQFFSLHVKGKVGVTHSELKRGWEGGLKFECTQ